MGGQLKAVAGNVAAKLRAVITSDEYFMEERQEGNLKMSGCPWVAAHFA